MKKQWKRSLALALVLILIAGIVSPATSAEGESRFAVGDLIEFGTYPQTEVTDETLTAALNADAQTWQSYGHYIGYGAVNGSMCASDFMQYCDVSLNGAAYRGVRFSTYRPYRTAYTSAASNSYQDDNGYQPDTVCWFRWEPLTWRVLDPDAGLILCETIIDAQPVSQIFLAAGKDAYNGSAVWGDLSQTYYANNYAHALIRAFLTDETSAGSFLNTAFTAAQRGLIQPTTLDNSAYRPGRSDFDSESTTDQVFLLSWSEVQNTGFGFTDSFSEDPVRRAQGSDYAKCQGLRVYDDTYSTWWLRTGGNNSSNTCGILHTGAIDGYTPTLYSDASEGVRPALRVDPDALQAHMHSYTKVVTPPTCLAGGYTTYTCACGESYNEDVTDALGHDFGEWVVTVRATTETEGEKTRTCSRCGITETETIPVLTAKVRDLVEFGRYPQMQVTDESLVAALNAAPQTWKSYGYYSGTTFRNDGTMTSSDYMQFCDVTYAGETYRGVRFTQYRPYYTCYPPRETLTEQTKNGYYINTTYWFKWQPLVWRILDPNKGLLLCETVIDAQPFTNYVLNSGEDLYPQSDGANWGNAEMTYYANNYAYSSIRQWLTSASNADSFLNTAFTASQRDSIRWTTLDNSAFDEAYSGYNAPSTSDKIFLLSFAEATNANYGFRDFNGYDAARKAVGTDYARCQGLSYPLAGGVHTLWWLRSANETSLIVCSPDADGWITGTLANANGRGVRPALRVDLSYTAAHTHDYTAVVTAPTCTEDGYTTHTCTCGDQYTDSETSALGHVPSQDVVVTEPTCTEAGYTTYTCTRCTQMYTGDETPALGHIPSQDFVVTEVTCTTDGYTTYTCQRCAQTYDVDIIHAPGHDFGDWTVTQAPTHAEAGLQTRQCARCRLIETETIPMLTYEIGDLVELGSYPQTKVTDKKLIAALNAAPQTWKSYGYESGSMQYCDVEYNGALYRGVQIEYYRDFGGNPYITSDVSGGSSYQDDNGYLIGTAYWFRWEPLLWYVVDPDAGKLLCTRSIDSQQFNPTYQKGSSPDPYGQYPWYNNPSADSIPANNYAASSIRAWLTDESDPDSFLNKAFSAQERALLLSTWLDNCAFSDDYEAYGGEPTNDKVFLLGYFDIVNRLNIVGNLHYYYYPEYFNWHYELIEAGGTDYAVSQGLDVSSWGSAAWLLRTPGDNTAYVCSVDCFGCVPDQYRVEYTYSGVRPAVRVDLRTVTPHAHSYTETVTATCTEGGDTVYTCICGESYMGDHVDALGHDFGDWVVTTPATTEAEGVETRTCERCGAAETRAIPKLPIPAVLDIRALNTEPVYTGDTVVVAVEVTENPGIAGMRLAIHYDPAVLTLTNAQTAGMLLTGTASILGEMTDEPLTVEWTDALADNHTETGEILALTFVVKEDAAPGETQITMTYETASTFDQDLHPVPLTLGSLALPFSLHMPGDVDGDGVLDLADTANLIRFLVGGWDDTSVDERNADVDGDGMLTLRDVVLLRRYLAGWEVTLV